MREVFLYYHLLFFCLECNLKYFPVRRDWIMYWRTCLRSFVLILKSLFQKQQKTLLYHGSLSFLKLMAWKLFFFFFFFFLNIKMNTVPQENRDESEKKSLSPKSFLLSLIAITWRVEAKNEQKLMKQIMGSLRVFHFPFIELKRKHRRKGKS